MIINGVSEYIENMVKFENHLAEHPSEKCIYFCDSKNQMIEYRKGDIYDDTRSNIGHYLFRYYYDDIDDNVLEWLHDHEGFYSNLISRIFDEGDLEIIHYKLHKDIIKCNDGDLYMNWNQFNTHLDLIKISKIMNIHIIGVPDATIIQPINDQTSVYVKKEGM